VHKRNTALYGLPFALVNKTNGEAVTTGTASAYVLKSGGSLAPATNLPEHEINGQWSIDLTASEMNAAVVGVIVAHADAIPVNLTILTTEKRVSELDDFNPATETVTTDAASRSASRADVSALALETTARAARYKRTTEIALGRDEANSQDDWIVVFKKGGTAVLDTEVSTPLLTVVDIDGNILINGVTPTVILPGVSAFKWVESNNRVPHGEGVFASAGGIVDGTLVVGLQPIGGDQRTAADVTHWNNTAVQLTSTGGGAKPFVCSDVYGVGGAQEAGNNLRDLLSGGGNNIELQGHLTGSVNSVVQPVTCDNPVAITPVVSTVSAGAVSEGNITAYQDAAATFAFAVVDSNEQPIDLSGKSIDFIVERLNRDTVEFTRSTGGDGITVGGDGNNVVTVTLTDDHTAAPGVYRYFMRNQTDDTPLADGALQIKHAPDKQG